MPRSFDQQVETHERQGEVMRLRLEGLTYQEIANRLGYSSASGAYKAAQRALLDLSVRPSEELRRLEILRLEQMLLTVWPTAMNPEHPRHMKAIDAALDIVVQIAEVGGLFPAKPTRPTGRRR